MTMGRGAITQYIDVAQMVLYVFWVFFAGLVFYLLYESKREGFPLESDRRDGSVKREPGILPMPRVKIYRTRYHGDFPSPHERDWQDPPVQGERAAPVTGMPYEPTGDPMTSGIGPGAFTRRSNEPDLTVDGDLKIVPLAAAPDFTLVEGDPDPRGMPVIGVDDEVGGTVVEAWVDRSEHMLRYLEVQTAGGRRVMLPITFARVIADRVHGRKIIVRAIRGSQLEGVPGLARPDRITLFEEEKVMGYFGAGTLFATPERREPLL
jgi:photosynthetic reaction center H subunit